MITTKKKTFQNSKRNNEPIIIGESNTSISEMDKFSRKKMSKDVVELNSTINQLDIINICRHVYARIAEYTFFSS